MNLALRFAVVPPHNAGRMHRLTDILNAYHAHWLGVYEKTSALLAARETVWLSFHESKAYALELPKSIVAFSFL
jgi:hypothetical protein